ncbi:MAG: XkdX family protein [Lachnospiraceae bacterium]|nr:XkdX family protein [Lachnospiraceae bacterium]
MAKIWRNRIIAGDKKFSSCPPAYKNAVIELLKDDVKKGIISNDDYDLITKS